jgi:hypothetical protein
MSPKVVIGVANGWVWDKATDAPPSSLKNSTTSLKVKTTEGEGFRVCSLVRNTSRVEGRVGALGWELGRLIGKSITHMDLHKPNNKLLVPY